MTGYVVNVHRKCVIGRIVISSKVFDMLQFAQPMVFAFSLNESPV
jgi:hypothetical protein